uniref:Ras-GEF domain-containing protein n=1 Tax=Arcella intermedia TaxID=1963864 RepID=A0A6B2KZU9_9EUKA
MIQKIVSEHEQNTEFRDFFFLIYSTFCSPLSFLNSVVDIFKGSSDAGMRTSIINLVSFWMTHKHSDFVSDPGIAESFENWCKWASENDKASATQLVPLQNKRVLPTTERIIKTTFNPDYEPVVPESAIESIHDIDSEEFARQLTLMEAKTFCELEVNELLNQNWTKNKKLAPVVTKMADRFNIMSSFVKTELLSHTTVKSRLKALSKFIEIIEHLLKYKNYNGALEIISAIDSSSVRRLKSTFGNLSVNKTALLEDSKKLLEKNFLLVRQEINQDPKGIPYLGMYQTDLTQIDEGNPSTINGMINMKKRVLIAKTLQQIQKLQSSTTYPFVPIPSIQDFIKNLNPITDDDVLYQFSLYLEPRSVPPEMPEKLKTLLEEKSKTRRKTKATPKPKSIKSPTVRKPNESSTVILAKHVNNYLKTYQDLVLSVNTQFDEILKDSPSQSEKITQFKTQYLLKMHNTHITNLQHLYNLAQDYQNQALTKKTDLGLFPIYCDPSIIPASLKLPTLVEWLWNNDTGSYTPFDTKTSLLIEAEYQRSPDGVLHLPQPSGVTYIVDFKMMTQTNSNSGFAREIQRRSNWIKETEHKRRALELEEKIKLLEAQQNTKKSKK